jgi:hypothetical protein
MLPSAGLYAGAEMEIEFRIVDVEHPDASGAPAPLPWAELLAEVSMPSMPSMPAFTEIAHREGIPGVFGVHPTFPHGGDYRFCLTLAPPAVQPASATRPAAPLTFEFPLTVWDAESSPTPVPARIRPFTLDLSTSPRMVLARQDATLELTVRLAGSRELREVTDFDVQHERLMHLFLVRDDLAFFAHEHPERVGPGTFRCAIASRRRAGTSCTRTSRRRTRVARCSRARSSCRGSSFATRRPRRRRARR